VKYFLLLSIIIGLSTISCDGDHHDGDHHDRRYGCKTKWCHKMKKLNANNQNQFTKNEVNVDIINKVSLSINNLRVRNKRKIEPICRAMDGCLRVCEYFDQSTCKQLVVSQVVTFWLNQIRSYNKWEQVRNDLSLIATESIVSSFLKNVDVDNNIVNALFRLSHLGYCPFANAQELYFSQTPQAFLYLQSSNEELTANEETTPSSADSTDNDNTPEGTVTNETSMDMDKGSTLDSTVVSDSSESSKDNMHKDSIPNNSSSESSKDNMMSERDNTDDDMNNMNNMDGNIDSMDNNMNNMDGNIDSMDNNIDSMDNNIDSMDNNIDSMDNNMNSMNDTDKISTPNSEVITTHEASVAGEQAENANKENINASITQQDKRSPLEEFSVRQQIKKPEKMKKVVDGSLLSFSLPVFAGFIKKCFGYNNRTFSELALELENKDAFALGHQVITEACGENRECIRLAYCTIGSKIVLDNMEKNMQSAGCETDSFAEILP